jgi:hypothetical protein
VKASNSCGRTLIFGSFLLLSFVKFFSLPLFHSFDLTFYCLFSFFDLVFLSPFIFPFFFALVLYLSFFFAHVVSSLAYHNLLGNKMLGCCCCMKGHLSGFCWTVESLWAMQIGWLLGLSHVKVS